MRIYPAIDIKDGKAVRLVQGKFDEVTVFNDNPAEAAKRGRKLELIIYILLTLTGRDMEKALLLIY